LSNMNRLRAAVHHVGVPKTIVRARQILELDPRMSVSLVHEGLTPRMSIASLRKTHQSVF